MMNTRKLLICAPVLALALTLTPKQSQAFDFLGAAWCCDTITFCVKDRFQADATPNNQTCLAGGSWAQSVRSAAATWNSMGLAFDLRDGHGTISSGCSPDINDSCRFTPTMDNQNTVSLAKNCDFPAGFLAVAQVWTNTQTCCIIEADICFSDFRNSNEGWFAGIQPNQCPGGQAGTCFDVETVALHEFGHWIGLGHEDDFIGGFKQVMHSGTGPCDIRRVPTADDTAGIQYVCGPNTVIQQSQRCTAIHSHPAYATSTKVGLTGVCQLVRCLGTCFSVEFDFDQDGICDSADNCFDIQNVFQEDTDNDGWGDACDCDINDPAVNPGATENCTNGIDDDCNFAIDAADPACGPVSCCGVAGDADNGGDINIGDATFIVKYIFQNGLKPPCCDEADADGGGDVNIGDATHIVKFIFQNGAPPVCPNPGGLTCL